MFCNNFLYEGIVKVGRILKLASGFIANELNIVKILLGSFKKYDR